MSKKLFVGGLSWGTADGDLAQAFSQFGDIVEAKVITDRETGRSRGFGFVTFSNEEDGQQAKETMDGSTLDGRTIRVNDAEARAGGGGGGGGGGGAGRPPRRPGGGPGGGGGGPGGRGGRGHDRGGGGGNGGRNGRRR